MGLLPPLVIQRVRCILCGHRFGKDFLAHINDCSSLSILPCQPRITREMATELRVAIVCGCGRAFRALSHWHEHCFTYNLCPYTELPSPFIEDPLAAKIFNAMIPELVAMYTDAVPIALPPIKLPKINVSSPSADSSPLSPSARFLLPPYRVQALPPRIAIATEICFRAGFRTEEELWLLYRFALKIMHPVNLLVDNIEEHFFAVLEHIIPDDFESVSFIGIMVLLLLPKLGLTGVLGHKCPISRFREYPIPQIEELVHQAIMLGGPDGLRRHADDTTDSVAQTDPEDGDGTSRVPTTPNKYLRTETYGTVQAALQDRSPPIPANRSVLEDLRAFHPDGGSGAFDDPIANPPPIEDSVELIRQAATQSTTWAAGPSGWDIFLVQFALRSDRMAKFLAILLEGMRRGDVPARILLCACRLNILPNGTIVHSVTFSECFYHVIVNAILLSMQGNINSGLLPSQFGFCASSDADTIHLTAKQFCHGGLQHYEQIATLDFSNSHKILNRQAISRSVKTHYPDLFNLIRWGYDGPSPLIYSARLGSVCGARVCVEVPSAHGVRDGDPLAPLIFSVTFRSFLEAFSEALGPDHFILSYLDYVLVLSKNPTNVIDIAEETTTRIDIGLLFNRHRCRVYTRDDIPVGIPILGSTIGGDHDEPAPPALHSDLQMTPILSDSSSDAANVDMQPAYPQTPPALYRP